MNKVLFRCGPVSIELDMPRITKMTVPNWKKLVKFLRKVECDNAGAFIVADNWFNLALQEAEYKAKTSYLKSNQNNYSRLAKFYKIFKGDNEL